MIECDTLRHRERTEFFVIIAQKFQRKWFAFLAFRERKYFVDITAGAYSRYMMVALCFCLDEFLHFIPMRFGHLVLQQTNGSNIERLFKYKLSIAEKCEFSASTAYIDVQVRFVFTEILGNMIFIDQGRFFLPADDLYFNPRLGFNFLDDIF